MHYTCGTMDEWAMGTEQTALYTHNQSILRIILLYVYLYDAEKDCELRLLHNVITSVSRTSNIIIVSTSTNDKYTCPLIVLLHIIRVVVIVRIQLIIHILPYSNSISSGIMYC